jgi:hypothetical protein
VKPFRWASDKNDRLVAERDVSFEEITVAVEAGGLLEVVAHPNPGKYPGQKIMVVAVGGYAYLVPFVEEAEHYFLKTIIPSRKATRDFIERGPDDVQAGSVRAGGASRLRGGQARTRRGQG